MATINFYLDKPDKKGSCPVHLRVNCSGRKIKASTGLKVAPGLFDKDKQRMVDSAEDALGANHFLDYLQQRTESFLSNPYKNAFTDTEVKFKINELVQRYQVDSRPKIVEEQLDLYGKTFTFIDLFAGAGGFSEGFLQAEVNNKMFKFLLANDINENCELTHLVRYNYQLGLQAEFLRQDITEPDFLDNLMKRLKDKKIDVVCGGPPCQSFSLAGKRKKFDKKDDLFSHYLSVIKILKPKYFVMENVKGILTKEGGKIRERILSEIRSIVDRDQVVKLEKFLRKLVVKEEKANSLILESLVTRVSFERAEQAELEGLKEDFIRRLDSRFKVLTPKIVDYKTSKTDKRISTIRHGFNLLLRHKQLELLQRNIIKEKDQCDVDNDFFVDGFTDFLQKLEGEAIIKQIEEAFDLLPVPKENLAECKAIVQALQLYIQPFEECLSTVRDFCDSSASKTLDKILSEIRLYNIDAPFVANASNYGVPQNRERVLFIGCRKDQKMIKEIPATVTEAEKVTVFEALHDLDFLGNNDEATEYIPVDIKQQYNGSAEKLGKLIRQRAVNGPNGKKAEKTYAEWSKEGRLLKHYDASNAFYVRNIEALINGERTPDLLHNHKTSKQNDDVVKRLKIILESGDYNDAKEKLNACGLSSEKRNYNVLNPEKQSPTVMTIPDDYIHYNSPRALTVREMARLQSFDDSFVFQGKRSTGGHKRKTEVPQYSLVGNAVPPLMARAVAMEVLKHIK